MTVRNSFRVNARNLAVQNAREYALHIYKLRFPGGAPVFGRERGHGVCKRKSGAKQREVLLEVQWRAEGE